MKKKIKELKFKRGDILILGLGPVEGTGSLLLVDRVKDNKIFYYEIHHYRTGGSYTFLDCSLEFFNSIHRVIKPAETKREIKDCHRILHELQQTSENLKILSGYNL